MSSSSMQEHARLDARILILDDEQANVDLLEMSLARGGYRHVLGTTDPRTILGLVQEFEPDLILLDLLMPYFDGFAVMEQLRALILPDDYLPILVLTADITQQAKRRALGAGAHDFLTKPFDQIELSLRITNLLETRLLYLQSRRQYQMMERLFHEAQELAQQREDAQLVLSHDLGQPLAALQLASRLLQSEATTRGEGATARLLERLNLVQESTRRVVAMTGELLDLARLQRGQELELHYVQTDLVALVRAEVAAQQASSERHTIRFEPESPSVSGQVDAGRLSRVIANLIGNAIKYSPAGGEILVCLVEERADEQQCAVLTVEDAGIGIPASEIARIGEQFFRASNVKGRITGTGVGILSVRRIVEAHGGTLQLESQEGLGTRMTVRLPLA